VADGKIRLMNLSYMRLTSAHALSVRPLYQLRSGWTVIGNTGSSLDAICRLMYGPSNDRGANNNGRANAAGGFRRPHRWPRQWLHRVRRLRRLR
jgi:hypothetical protein